MMAAARKSPEVPPSLAEPAPPLSFRRAREQQKTLDELALGRARQQVVEMTIATDKLSLEHRRWREQMRRRYPNFRPRFEPGSER